MAPILVGLACGASFLIGMRWAKAPVRSLLVPIVTPVSVTVPAAQVVVTPAPEPPPPAVVEAPAPPRPRALAPHLAAAHCLIPIQDVEDPTCAWDDGFPAISRDGRLVATRYQPEDGGRGYPGESIHLIDVKTGRVVRDALVLSPDEYSEAPKAQAKLRVTMARRAAAIQQVLDAGEFRALSVLGAQRDGQDVEPPDATKIHAEIVGGMMRVIDPATTTVIGQYGFGVASRHPAKPDGECSGWTMAQIAVWWDPATKVTLGTPTYYTGGCMCPSETLEQVGRLR
ncbi:MAG: hypothetical protein ABIY55_08725 [Kofleriaceae bacterium]